MHNARMLRRTQHGIELHGMLQGIGLAYELDDSELMKMINAIC